MKLQIKHDVKTWTTGQILRKWNLNYKSTIIEVESRTNVSNSPAAKEANV